MSAKHKLNSAHFCGAFVVAGVAGLATESFAVFGLTFVCLLVAGHHAGDIRR